MIGGENMDQQNAECCEEFCTHGDVLKRVQELLPDVEELYDLAELFKVFGDTTRIRILFGLFESEMCVCDIAEMLSPDAVGDLASAEAAQAVQAGQEPQGSQDDLLFAGRRPCAFHH